MYVIWRKRNAGKLHSWGVSLIIPLMLLKYGFNSNWDVLFLDSTRVKIIVIPLIIDSIGYFLMAIPFLFWDYTDDKQFKVIEVLRRREEVTRKQLEAERAAELTDAPVEEVPEEVLS